MPKSSKTDAQEIRSMLEVICRIDEIPMSAGPYKPDEDFVTKGARARDTYKGPPSEHSKHEIRYSSINKALDTIEDELKILDQYKDFIEPDHIHIIRELIRRLHGSIQ